MPELVIPEDLRPSYSDCATRTGNVREDSWRDYSRELIERIARLEAALRAAIPQMEYKRDHSQSAQGRKNAARVIEQARAVLSGKAASNG